MPAPQQQAIPKPTTNSYDTKAIIRSLNYGLTQKNMPPNPATEKKQDTLTLKIMLTNLQRPLAQLKKIQVSYHAITQNKDKIIIPAVQKDIEKELPSLERKINDQEKNIRTFKNTLATLTEDRIKLLEKNPNEIDALNKLSVTYNGAVNTQAQSEQSLTDLEKQVLELFKKAKNSLPETDRHTMQIHDPTVVTPRSRS